MILNKKKKKLLYAVHYQNIIEFSSNDKFLATTASTCCYRISPFFSFFSFGYVILYQTSLTQSHLITSKMTVRSSYRLYSPLSYFFCNIKLQSISTEIQAEHPSFFSFYTDQQLDPSSFLFFSFFLNGYSLSKNLILTNKKINVAPC